MNERGSDKFLTLTEDEAMGLLDIILLCPMDLSPDQRAATEKLTEFCRSLIRESSNSESKPVVAISSTAAICVS